MVIEEYNVGVTVIVYISQGMPFVISHINIVLQYY